MSADSAISDEFLADADYNKSKSVRKNGALS